MRDHRYHATLLLIVLGLLCFWSVQASLANARAFNFYCNDDAYISFTYAKNLIHGRGLVFNPGEFVEGYTNFLWLMFLVPWMMWLPATDVSTIAIFWGACFSVAVMILLYILGHQERGHHWTNLIAPALLSADNTFHYWSISGLESALQTALVLCGYIWFFRKTPRAPWISGAFFALATMTRPDSGLLWAVCTGCLLLRALRTGEERGVAWRNALRLAAGFIALAAPYCAWKLHYYGSILPNTFYLHTGNRLLRMDDGAAYVTQFLANRYFLPLLALASGLFGYSFRRAVLLLSVFSFSAYILWIGGDFFPGSRFFYVLLPLLYLLVQEAIAEAASRAPAKGFYFGAVTTAVLFAVLFFGSYGERGEYRHFVLVWAEDDLQRIQLARDLSRIARPGDSILSGPIGQIGYYSGMAVLDYWGVIDPHIARKDSPEAVYGVPAHDKSDLAYLLGRKPTYIIFGVEDPDRPPRGYAWKKFEVEGRQWTLLARDSR